MNRFLVFIFLNLFISASLFAQVELSFGLVNSLPLGKYKSTSLQEGGFAENGWGIFFDSKTSQPNWPLNLKLGFHFSYQEHEFSQSELTRVFDAFFKEQIGDEYSTLISVGYYKPIVMTLGPNYDWDFAEKFSANFKSGVGVMFTNMDQMRFNILDGTNQIIAQQTLQFEGNAVFTYFVGAVLDYNLSESWSLGFSIDHSAANEKITTSFATGGDIDAEQRVSFLNLGLQLSFKL